MQGSEHIKPRQTLEMLRKGRFAYHRGTPLTWQVVIDFGYAEFGKELAIKRSYKNIRDRVYNWWAYKREKGIVHGQFVDWGVWEAPNGKYHIEWLIHVPEHLQDELEQVILNRCEKVLGALPFDAVDQKPLWNTNGAMKYALEGTEPTYAKDIGIRPKPQGIVFGRRTFGARALGVTAREKFLN